MAECILIDLFLVRILYHRSDYYTDSAIFRTVLFNVLVRSGPTRSENYTRPYNQDTLPVLKGVRIIGVPLYITANGIFTPWRPIQYIIAIFFRNRRIFQRQNFVCQIFVGHKFRGLGYPRNLNLTKCNCVHC